MMNNDPYERLIHDCEMIRTHWEKKYAKLESASISVVRAASIGDQNFISCLHGNDATELRHALADLTDVLKDE